MVGWQHVSDLSKAGRRTSEGCSSRVQMNVVLRAGLQSSYRAVGGGASVRVGPSLLLIPSWYAPVTACICVLPKPA